MEPIVLVSLVTGILGCVAGIGGLFIAWRKVGPERQKLEAEARRTNAQTRNIDLDSLADLNEALMAEIERLRQEMRQERADTDATIAVLRRDLNHTQVELAQAQDEIRAGNARIAQLQTDNDRLKKALDQSLDAARRLKADLDRALADLAKAQKQIEALENGGNQCACADGSHGEKADS